MIVMLSFHVKIIQRRRWNLLQEKSLTIDNSEAFCLANVPFNPVSRLAPTPSGFLHLGNAVNFLVTWAIVRSLKGRIHLRIDDMDGIRFRPDVLEDIFKSLDWLDLDWDTGPSGPDDFYQNFSLHKKRSITGEDYKCLIK